MKAPEPKMTNHQQPGVLEEMPRRRLVQVTTGEAGLSLMRFVSFETRWVYAFLRLFTWLRLIIHFSSHIAWDKLRGKDSLARQGEYLRHVFAQAGGSFIKLGIHLSMRVDFMPWAYCNELSRLADRMPPFPLEQAIAILERSTHGPLAATFHTFDPKPILSTSVANIYQAVLHNGKKVAVKVRRPGIGEQFMADVQAFDWLLSIAEFLTIFRPGFTHGMRAEFRSLLIEELDFVQEARRQHAFRRAAAKTGKKFFSTPRIYLDLCSEEVVINHFASGMWLWEYLAALEKNDTAVLSLAQSMKIDPRKVARRLLWVNNWGWEENLFFHADPHPNNIIIGKDSTLYFVDFTSTGTLSHTKRRALRQNLYYARERDPQNMARSCMALMEPLPPIDLIVLTQELESYNWQMIYTLEAAPHSLSWQERTSVTQWMGLLRLARKYGMSLDIQVLRVLRATLLSESMAVRLDPTINFVDEYWKFDDFRAEQARREVLKGLQEQSDGKTNELAVVRIDRTFQVMEDLLSRVRHMLSMPTVNFNLLVGKWSFGVTIFFSYVGQVLGLTAFALLLAYVLQVASDVRQVALDGLLPQVLGNPLYLLVVLGLTFISGRTVLFRLDDKETS